MKIVLALSILLSVRAGCGRSTGLYRGKAASRLRVLRNKLRVSARRRRFREAYCEAIAAG
ncbi:hypothetical protein RGR602_PC00538 (plasmid) [Rhizobium gallicum bv. gallicum R602sp]|uniref:Uncharacterized protein n=1 Tax=Rhizobium gallicum bv. gallicum R602sp TaxID=1041138 RepID=A0A0B4XDA0_9HYPH|nr:hypothetical protein RGR602_PC00538 [Rhizobium gallicum bv. gallicum R602sp]